MVVILALTDNKDFSFTFGEVVVIIYFLLATWALTSVLCLSLNPLATYQLLTFPCRIVAATLRVRRCNVHFNPLAEHCKHRRCHTVFLQSLNTYEMFGS